MTKNPAAPDVAEGVPAVDRVGSDATWNAPPTSLPRAVEGAVKLCHVCRSWKPKEYVRNVGTVPTCTGCKPDPKLDDRPALLEQALAAEAAADAVEVEVDTPKRKRRPK